MSTNSAPRTQRASQTPATQQSVIDFTDFPKRNKSYDGANGNKISVLYHGDVYMLKFPSHAKRNEQMSYSNSCFSEHLGCQVFASLGIPVQQTLLGTYRVHAKAGASQQDTAAVNTKIVVACKDFTSPGVTLQDFASLKNQRSARKGSWTSR